MGGAEKVCIAGNSLLPGLATPRGAWSRLGGSEVSAQTTPCPLEVAVHAGWRPCGPRPTWSIIHEVGNFSKSLQTIQKLQNDCKVCRKCAKCCKFSTGANSLQTSQKVKIACKLFAKYAYNLQTFQKLCT